MNWYAVTDSDWDWDTTDDGDGAPAIVCAEDPQDAIRKAIAQWQERDPNGFDGICVKVARLDVVGFQSCDIDPETKAPMFEEFFAHQA